MAWNFGLVLHGLRHWSRLRICGSELWTRIRVYCLRLWSRLRAGSGLDPIYTACETGLDSDSMAQDSHLNLTYKAWDFGPDPELDSNSMTWSSELDLDSMVWNSSRCTL